MKKLFLLLFCLGSLYVRAQVPLIKSKSFAYEYQSLKVNKIFSDKSGYLWLGTQLGLFQHDGMNVSHFSFPDSVAKRSINFIEEGPNSIIYLGTSDGKLFRVKSKGALILESVLKVANGTSLSSICFDQDGNCWVGTNGEGVFIISNGKQFQVLHSQGLVDNGVNTLSKDLKGNIWIGTDRGISLGSIKNDKISIKDLNENSLLPDPIITLLKRDLGGGMIVGTQSKGAYIYNSAQRIFEPICKNRSWDFGMIIDLVQQDKQYWIATDVSGLVKIENNIVKHKTHASQSEFNNRLTAITHDKEGNIWVSDGSENVISFNNLFSFLMLPFQMKGDIRSLAVDSENGIWFSDIDQCYYWKDGVYVELPKSVRKIKPVSIYPDSNGNIWFATFGEGVFRFEPKTGKLINYIEKNGLANNNVISINGNKNTLYFATFGGVSFMDCNQNDPKQKIFSATSVYGLPKGYYYQVFIDSKQRVWFASDGLGVSCLNDNKIQYFNKKDGLSSTLISAISEDSKGNIWFNSPQTGLYKYDGKIFENYGTKSGIRELGYNAIIADNKENLVLVNGKGIDMFNINNGNVLYHDQEIGFEAEEQTTKLAFKDKNGRIWVGSGQNLIVYDPSRNYLWDGPKPIIKKAYLYLNEFEMTSGKEFNANENHITFDYIGVWYHLPEEVNYLIKLDGYDRDWVKSRNLQVTYPKLPPGKYTFRVKALPSNNFKTSKEVSYSFQINPPYYQSIWFIGLIIVLAACLIWLIFSFRIKQLKEKERAQNDRIKYKFETLRSQINPHFLFNSFNTLSGLIDSKPEDAIDYVEHLSDFFRKILLYKEKDLISVAAELLILDDYLFIQKKRFGASLQIEISQEIRESDFLIAPMTLQILAENAIKHNVVSKAMPLKIMIEATTDEYLEIKNVLQEKSTHEASTQIGLSNIISRYAILQKRKVIIEQSETYFTVKIPLIRYV